MYCTFGEFAIWFDSCSFEKYWFLLLVVVDFGEAVKHNRLLRP